ncbi:type IV pilus modification protein PilV [Motiliproteus sp. SC1-56]|uniref:type IV pilus modification protein PilV n=1 Tax=Motiliproteus sp. SC1-56 TaxID=2799565 RepID=UPI001A8D247F|nr:type IV pilus modification protein PilV [Motiliproteus sp. SC1-56]
MKEMKGTRRRDNGKRAAPRVPCSKGFTLVEVLVAVLVLSLGILGLIALESMALKNNHSAYQRSQATILAYDLADRVRANRDERGKYIVTIPSGKTHSATTCSSCSAEGLADNDLVEWSQDIQKLLPGASAAVTASGSVFTVTIAWIDNRERGSDTVETFQTSFRP